MIQFNMWRCSFKNAGIYPERLSGEEGRSDVQSFLGTSGDVSSYVHQAQRQECDEKLIADHLT